MSFYDDIRSALETQLSTIVGIPAIAWENVNFTPTTGTPYIQVRNLPTARRPAVRGLNPVQRYQGVFQLLVHYPEGVGPSASEDMVDLILTAFEATIDLSFTNPDTEVIYVTIDYSEQVGAYSNSPWYTTPVNIGYYSYR